jgi:hypothetical protein
MQIFRRIPSWALSVLCFALIVSITGCGTTGNTIRFSGDFESGNLPVAKQLDQRGKAWELALRNDNDDASLPDNFRTWWYLRADDVPVRDKLRLEFTRLGSRYYFVPVYSYDQKKWQYFDENDVTLTPGCDIHQPDTCRLVVSKQFSQPTVWIARTFPYTIQNLSIFLESLAENKNVEISQLGLSPHFQKPLQLITINAQSISSPKQTIWLHARTHSAETGPSFVLEGLIRSVLAEDELGSALRQKYIFKIVPMHNIDGVILGNYRTNASSINLEKQWLFIPGSPYLNSDAPLENRLMNEAMVSVMKDNQAPVVLALNLHSSNASPDTATFFFPHFGNDAKYTELEQNLWHKQVALIKSLAVHYDGRIEQPPQDDGGAGFLNAYFPESWWWANKADAVNAMTLETTYGRAGFDHWITQEDLRNLGVALAKSINEMSTQRVFETDDMSMFRLPFQPGIYSARLNGDKNERN